MLEQTQVHNEESHLAEQEEFMKLRTIMKYRLFGRDGVNDKEFQKLKDYIDPNSVGKPQFVIRRKEDYEYQLSII